jgi:hypothetical protein
MRCISFKHLVGAAGLGQWNSDTKPRRVAVFLKLLKLVQPRAAVVKICEVKRGSMTLARLFILGVGTAI